MEYRRATIDDGALLARMNARLVRDEGHLNPMTVEQLEARMREWLAGDYGAYIFKDARGAAGYVLYRHAPDAIYIRQFFVDPDRRRQHVGRDAFAWLAQNAWQGEPRLRLDVLIGNQAAIEFWRSLGFTDYCLTMERDAAE